MTSPETIEGEAVEVGSEVVPAAPSGPPPSLFRTDDPVEVLERAKTIANALAPVIREAGLVANISGKDYLNVEAWQTLGQQVGVTGVVTSTTRIEKGWEARCEARTLDGRTIGAADSMCTRDEERWKESEDFEIRSMAQTRAMSRALSSVLRFIPTLAGMGGTPAEEMGNVKRQSGASGKSAISDKQKKFIERLLKDDHGWADDRIQAAMVYVSKQTGGKEGGASKIITALKRDAPSKDQLACLDRLDKEADKAGGELADATPGPSEPSDEAYDEDKVPF